MSLDTAIIQQYYAGILRLTPSAATINAYAQLPSYEAAMDAMMNAAVSSVNPITKLYQAAFDRVPDSAGLTNYTAAYGAGAGTMTLKQIATQWTSTIEFTTDYPASMPNADYVGLLYWNVLHRAADPVGAANFTAALNTGKLTRADVLLELSQSPEFSLRIDGHIRGFQEQCALNDPAAYTGTLWDKVSPEAGVTYTLTTGVDVVPGTEGNDTVNGVVVTGTAASTTLNVFDSINGAGGINTLNANYASTAATFDASAIPTLNNIQIVNLTGVDGDAANTMDGAIAPQMTTVNVSNPIAAAGQGSFVLNNGSAATTNFGLSSIARDDFDVTYNSATGVFAGATDAVTLNLNGVTGAAPVAAGDGPAVAFVGAAAGQGVETINVVASGADRLASLTAVDGAGAQTVTNINVAGAGSLRVDGTLNFKSTSGTINAANNTGGVTFTVGAEDITFTGGSGNDRLNFAAAGDLTAADTINFGTGVNTLGLADTTISTSLYSLINATAAERVAFTAGITADLSKLTANVVVVDNNIAGNVFQKLAATDHIEVSTAAANVATIDATASLGYNTVNLDLAGTSTGVVDLNGVTTTNQTIVNLSSVGASGVVNDVGGFTNTANTTFTVTGSGSGLTMGTLAASAIVNASAYTGSTFSVTGANAASSFTTGTAVDTITLATLAGGDAVNTGAGNDIINTAALTGTTATSITGGLGADQINVGAATGSVAAKYTLNATAAESYATANHFDTVAFANTASTNSDAVTVVTGLLSTSLAAATSVTIGTTTVAQAGGFLWVNTAGSTAATNQDATLYQDSNANGVIDATDLQISFDLNATDTLAIALVGSQAVVTLTGV